MYSGGRWWGGGQQTIQTIQNELFKTAAEGQRTAENIKKNNANVPHLTKPLKQFAEDEELALEEMRARLEKIRAKLFKSRKTRIHPQKDDKILTDWNGLMISAFAKGGRMLKQTEYLNAATKANLFIGYTIICIIWSPIVTLQLVGIFIPTSP